MITFLINNEAFSVSQPTPLAQLLEMDGVVRTSQFAIAVNENFVPKTLYAETVLNDGDRIEILTPMQGG